MFIYGTFYIMERTAFLLNFVTSAAARIHLR